MNSTLSTPASRGVGAGEVEHLVGHVDADRLAGRADAAGARSGRRRRRPSRGRARSRLRAGRRRRWGRRSRATRRPRPRARRRLVAVERGAPDLDAVRVGGARGRRIAAGCRSRRRRTSRGRLRGCRGWPAVAPAAQPQVDALGRQQSAFSVGSQQVACASASQQPSGRRCGRVGQLSHADSSLRASGRT